MEIGEYIIDLDPAFVVIFSVVLFLIAAYIWSSTARRETKKTEFYIQRATINLR